MWLAACIPHSLGGLERLRQGHQGTERRGSVHRWNGQYLMHQRPERRPEKARFDKDLHGWCCSLFFFSLRVPDLCPSRHNATKIHGIEGNARMGASRIATDVFAR